MVVQGIIYGAMPVTKDEIIITLIEQVFPGILNDRFLFSLEGVDAMQGAAVPRPAPGDPEGEVRVETGEGPLKEPIGE